MKAILAFALLASFSAVSCADWTGKVVGVHDGDTLTVMQNGKGTKVRLVEIDAPESDQDYGQRSKHILSSLY